MKLWIDDIRPPRDDWVPAETFHATSSTAAMLMLDVHHEIITDVSFDHDLGGEDTTRSVVLWMAEHDIWPQRCYVHTANPVGREWLEGMLNRYGPGVTRDTSYSKQQ